MRVALVHDWLTGMRGGEKVLEELCRLFPDAPVYTLVHVRGSVSATIESHPVRVSPLSRVPGIAGSYRRFLPLFPALIQRFDLRGFDLVISTSSCVAKGARAPRGVPHLSYIHSPMRYVWDRFDDYFGPGRADPATRMAMRLLRDPLRRWDRSTSARLSRVLANSAFVAERIRRYWDLVADVVHPPVDTERFRPTGEPRAEEWLVVSALAPYKRVDVAIDAARSAGVPLAIVGRGPEEARLRRMAGPRVRFLGWCPDEELPSLYSRARGLLFPGVEDFGIVPLEALSCGCPVVAYAEGGATESLRGAAWEGDPGGWDRGGTGLFVREQTPSAFARAIRALVAEPDRFEVGRCRARAEDFGRPVFRRRMAAALTSLGAGPILAD